MFLVPTASPGYEIQPIHTLGGQVTNATFYTDVRIPDSARIGGVDEGWSVMNVALVYERGVASPASIEQTLARDLAAWATADPAAPTGRGRSTTRSWPSASAGSPSTRRSRKLLGQWVTHEAVQGPASPASRARCASSSTPRPTSATTATRSTSSAPRASWLPARRAHPPAACSSTTFRNAVVATVYGGTSEILRDIIAQRHLGLPRTRRRDK